MVKREKSKAEKPSKNNELGVKILDVMATLQQNGVKEVNSTTLKTS